MKTATIILAFAFAAHAAPILPRMTWGQDFHGEGMPFAVRVDAYRYGTRLVLSAGSGDRSPECNRVDLLSVLGIPHSRMADQPVDDATRERVIDQRARLRKAVGIPSDQVR